MFSKHITKINYCMSVLLRNNIPYAFEAQFVLQEMAWIDSYTKHLCINDLR